MKKRLQKEEICAVIVTFNPEKVFLENVHSLRKQVGMVIVVDNGSTKCEYLEAASREFCFDVLKLEGNHGIGYALNRGLQQCVEKGYPLMLTMDQDTVLGDNAVDEMLQVLNDTAAPSVGINWDGVIHKDKEVQYLITSGNLLQVDAAISIGGYDEKLFIDSVDFDFSLRLSERGGNMIKVTKAKARHQLGERQGEKGYITHSKERYYFIYRNHFYLIRKYWKKHKLFLLKKNMALFWDLILILLKDEEKKEKLCMIKKGYYDAMTMRPGIVNSSLMEYKRG